MGTSLIASLDTHCSISRYIASLFAQKSHSSRREQNASLIALSSPFFLLAQETTAFAHLLGILCPWACGGAGNPHSLRSTLIDVCNINGVARCRDSRSTSKVPYHCNMQGEPYKTPCHKKYLTKIPKYSNTKNPTKIPTYWKMSWYPHVLYYLSASPRATPGKIFLSERILAARANFCLIPCPGQNMVVKFPGGGAQFYQTRGNSPLSLQKILKKFRKLRESTNVLFGELKKTFKF